MFYNRYMLGGLFDLAIVFLLAAVLSVGAKLLKQPLVLAYLLTGALVAGFDLLGVREGGELFQIFSDLGIMFLLFLIGLEINYSALRAVGKVSLIVGFGQILFTSLFGFLLARLFDFSALPALYIAIALTFSSTIIILKLLTEKRDEHSLYGRISIGFLLVQDFVAILILIFLAGAGGDDGFSFSFFFKTLLYGGVLVAATLFLGRRILPKLFDLIAHSEELLFLASTAWAFLVVAIAYKFGFSLEIGGFLAGLALANSSENFQIAARIKPLRDFFILLFFVILGSSLVFSGISGASILPIIVLSLFVLVGNPLIVLVLMGLMGYRKRTSFLTGLTVAQVSEFSLVLVALGLNLEHIEADVVALVTAVGVITITLSTYLIVYADSIFRFIQPFLQYFERKKVLEEDIPGESKKSIVLIGCHRTGQSIAFSLPKEDLLIVDFDPEVIAEIRKHGFHYVFGDISDPDISRRVAFRDSKLVISTSPRLEDNLSVLHLLRKLGRRRPRVVLRAETERDAKELYLKGADYVLLPHFTAGQYLGKTIALDPDMKILEQLKKRDTFLMKQISSSV